MRRTIFFLNSVPFGGLGLTVLCCSVILLCQPSALISAESSHETHDLEAAHESHSKETGSQLTGLTSSGWDGSPEGKAYSEFNHHLAGTLVMLIGLGELHRGLGTSLFSWTRFFLPGAMLAAGTYLIIWSDHDAWPIGPESFTETFFGNYTETLQHKAYALLLLCIGSIELLRRSGRLSPRYWSLPLPAFAVIGGLVLFLHSHSDHLSAHKIAFHHATLGDDRPDGRLVPDCVRVRSGHTSCAWLLVSAAGSTEVRVGNPCSHYRRPITVVCRMMLAEDKLTLFRDSRFAVISGTLRVSRAAEN